MEDFFKMEWLRRKSESQKGNIPHNLKLKGNHSSLNALNHDGNVPGFSKNGIIDDEDVTDDDTRYSDISGTEICDNNLHSYSYSDATNNLIPMRQDEDGKSSECNSDIDVTSCKPCSVVLERLSEKQVHNLLSGQRQNSRSFNHGNRRLKNRRFTRYRRSKRLKLDYNLKDTSLKESNHLEARKKRGKVESSNCSDTTNQSDDEPHASCSNYGIIKNPFFLREDKVKYSNSENQVSKQDPRSTISQTEDLNENEGSGMCPEDPERKISPPKVFRLSLRKKKIVNTKDNETYSQYPGTEIIQADNLKDLKGTWINSEDSKNATSLLERQKCVFKRKPTYTKDAHCRNILQTKNLNRTEDSRLSSIESESNVLPPKRFNLSLKKQRTNTKKDDEACRQVSPRKILPLEDSGQIVEDNTVEIKGNRRSVKRKLTDTKGNEISVRKLKKVEEKQSAANHDESEVDNLDSLSFESNASRDTTNQEDQVEGLQILRNRRYRSKKGHEVRNIVPIVSTLKVSLVKLESKASSSTSKQVNNVRTLDRHIDTDEVDLDSESDIPETKPTNLDESSPKKTRNTKITDYFFSIDKSTVVSRNNNGNLNQKAKELLLKKKYGICKDAIVSLIDFKKFKIHESKYLASEIEELSQGSANSSINVNSSSTTANVLSPSLAVPSNNLPCSFSELSTNNVQSTTDFPNLLSVPDHVNNSFQDLLHTDTVPIAKSISPKGHKSPQVKKYLLTKSSRDPTNDEQSSSSSSNLLSAPDHVENSYQDLLHSCTVPIAKIPLLKCYKSPHVNKNSPTKSKQDSLNKNLLNTVASRKEKESSNLQDCSLVNENLDVNREVCGKDLSCQISPELMARSQSSPRVNKLGNHSSDSWLNTTTPKSSRTLHSQIRKLTPSPAKHIVVINDEKESNEPEKHVTEIISKSPQTNKVEGRSDTMPPTDVLEALPDANGLQQKSNDTSVLNKDSNTVISLTNVYPTFVSVIKSPVNMATPKARHLPVNSMTILSREMIEDDSSWKGLSNSTDDVTETSTTMPRDHSIEKDKSLNILLLDNTAEDKTITSSKTIKNVDDNSSKNSNPLGTLVNPGDANLSRDNRIFTESRDNNALLKILLSSSSAECPSPKRPAAENIEISVNEVTILTESGIVQKKTEDVQHSVSVSKIETSMLNNPSLASIPPVKDSIAPIPIECINEDHTDPNSEDESRTDCEQEGQLFIDLNDCSSEAQSVVPATSSPSCSKSNIIISSPDKEASKNKEESSNIECVICNKKFKHTNGLAQHLRMHVRPTDGSCLICDKPLTKKNAITHYLQHCGCKEDNPTETNQCGICKKKFKKRSDLTYHLKLKHNVGKNRVRTKINSRNKHHNKCDVCQLICKSEEDLFSHVYKHTQQELQDAFEAAIAKKKPLESSTTINSSSEKKKLQDKKQLSAELTKTTKTSAKWPLAISNSEESICMCHKDERLEISGGVIIEIALACVQCKTFFKTKKCLISHYNKTSCKSGDKTLITSKMFCNKCCMILNNLEEMHSHLTKHAELYVDMKTSLLCKHCNIFFFSVGSLFYTHWTNHQNDPLFLAHHHSFPKNMKVKIVEPEGPESAQKDEPTESLFIADHQCQKCEEPFQTENDLKKHLDSSSSCSEKAASTPEVIETPKSVFNLICSICNKEFVDKLTFDTHIEEHDTIKGFLHGRKDLDKSLGNNSLTCSICKITYDTIADYKGHLIRHEVIQEKFVCNYCTLMMDSVEDFELHSVEHKGTPEKPVACKVIFATAKFHCKPCKIWFDSQIILDEHLATHSNLLASDPKLAENSTTKIVPAVEKKSHVCETCQQEFDDQLKLDAHVSTHNKDASDQSIPDPILIHLSDDSNGGSEEVVVENILPQEQQETSNIQETKKPAFLRVKNLKELLPYACSKCKAEFDTQINLSKHICTLQEGPAQDKDFNYFCTICKNYQCDNDSDWNIHVLSHFPLRSSQKLNEIWYYIIKMRSGQQIFKCKICPNYESVTIHTMQHHFVISHRDIYQPVFKCRVCRTFKTESEQEIRQHEAAHFQHRSSLQQLTSLGNHLSTTQPVKLSTNSHQTIPPLTSTGNNTSTLQPAENYNNSQQLDSISSLINSSNNLPLIQSADNPNNFPRPVLNPSVTRSGNNLLLFQPVPNFINSQQSSPMPQPDNNSNNFQPPISISRETSLGSNFSQIQPAKNTNSLQQPVSNPLVNSSDNNLPNLIQQLQNLNNSQQLAPTQQPDNNSNNVQQLIPMPSVINSNSKLPSLQLVDNSNTLRNAVWTPPVSSSGNNLPLLQPVQSSNNLQQPVPTLPPNSNCNNFQQSISIPSVTISGSNLSTIQQVDISNKFQHPVSTSAVTNSGNNVPSHQPMQNFNNSQQSGSTLKSPDNSNNYQQSITIPPVTSSGNSLSSIQPMDNSQWLATTGQTFQIQINNATPFNNMTNVMHTLPMYVANVVYCCRICKNYKCSSEQELKVHESLHEFPQLGESPKRLYRCKVCTNIFCPTEEHLRAHMDVYHKSDKPNVSQNQTQSKVSDTEIQCKHCPQTFASSAQLTQHMYASHTFLDQRQNDTQFQHSYPYSCEFCSIGFLNEACLQAHIRQIHPTVKLPRQKSNDHKTLYQCDTCGLLLISEATLSYHMKSHNMGFR